MSYRENCAGLENGSFSFHFIYFFSLNIGWGGCFWIAFLSFTMNEILLAIVLQNVLMIKTVTVDRFLQAGKR